MVLIVADATRSMNRLWLIERITQVLENCPDTYSLIVFGRRGMPLIDRTDNLDIIKRALEEYGFLPGIPEPYYGLKEAIELYESLDQSEFIHSDLLLMWSMAKKPKREIIYLSRYLLSTGLRIHVLTSRTSAPRWINTVLGSGMLLEEVKIYFKRSTQKYKELKKTLGCK